MEKNGVSGKPPGTTPNHYIMRISYQQLPGIFRKETIMANPKNRELVYKALTDPAFRKKLETDPGGAVGKPNLTQQQRLEVKKVISFVDEIQGKIGRIADELLCANGGPCGIARGDVEIKDRK
jgi:hypothetical protein